MPLPLPLVPAILLVLVDRETSKEIVMDVVAASLEAAAKVNRTKEIVGDAHTTSGTPSTRGRERTVRYVRLSARVTWIRRRSRSVLVIRRQPPWTDPCVTHSTPELGTDYRQTLFVPNRPR